MRIENELDSDSDQQDIPDHLLCPITSEMMADPVIAEDGHTYERAALMSWIERNPTSPMTREPIGQMVIPNRGIKAAIEEYKERQAAERAQAAQAVKPPVDIEPFLQGLIASYQAQSHLYRIDDEVKPLPIEKCFVNLEIIRESERKQEELQQIEQASDSSAHLITGNHRSETTAQNRNAIEIANLLPDNDKHSNKVLIYGRAGIGKSTLCRYIASQWSAQKLWYDRFDWVIWIPLRTLISKNYRQDKQNITAIDLITTSCIEHHDQKGLMRTSDDAKVALRDKLATMTDRTLIMLDGFDELDWNAVPHLHNAFYQLMNFPYVIVTSRPNYRIENVHMDAHLEITGFKPKEIRSFVHLFFEDDPKTASKCLNYLMSNDKLWGIAQIPINIELLCSVFRSNKLTADQLSLTMVYQHLEFWLLQRAIQRQGKFIPEANTPTQYFAKELTLLSELAFKAMCEGKVLIPSELLNQCQSYDEATMESALRLGLVKVLKEGLFFIHLTFQEYFAGRHVAITPLSEIEPIIGTMKYQPRLELMWWFAAGCLRDNLKSLQAYLTMIEASPQDLIGIQSLYLLVGCLEEAQVPNLNVTRRVTDQLLKVFRVVIDWNTFRNDCALSIEKYFDLFSLASKLIQKNADKFTSIWLGAWHKTKDDLEKQRYLLMRLTSSAMMTPEMLNTLLQILTKDSDSVISENCRLIVKKTTITQQHLPILQAASRQDPAKAINSVAAAVYKLIEYHYLKSDDDLSADLVAFVTTGNVLSRLFAIEAIADFAKPSHHVRTLLDKILNDDSPKVLVAAINTLKQFQPLTLSAVYKIISLLRHNDPTVRLAAIESLAIVAPMTADVELGLLKCLSTKDCDTLKIACETLHEIKVAPEKFLQALLPVVQQSHDFVIQTVGIKWLASCSQNSEAVLDYLFSCLSDFSLRPYVFSALGKIAKANPGAISDRVTSEFRRLIRAGISTTIDISVAVVELGEIRPVTPETLECLKYCLEHKPNTVAQAAANMLRQIGVSADEFTVIFLNKLSQETFAVVLFMKVLLEFDYLPRPVIDRCHELIRKYPHKSYILSNLLKVVFKFDRLEPSADVLIDTLDPDIKGQTGDTDAMIIEALGKLDLPDSRRIVDLLTKRLPDVDKDKPLGIAISSTLSKLAVSTPAIVVALINLLLKADDIFGFHHKHQTIKAIGKLGIADDAVINALHQLLDNIGDTWPAPLHEVIMNAFIDLRIATPELISARLRVLKKSKYYNTKHATIAGFQGLLPLYKLEANNIETFVDALTATCTSCVFTEDGHCQIVLGNRVIEFSYPPELSGQLEQAIHQAMEKQGLSFGKQASAQANFKFFRNQPAPVGAELAENNHNLLKKTFK